MNRLLAGEPVECCELTASSVEADLQALDFAEPTPVHSIAAPALVTRALAVRNVVTVRCMASDRVLGSVSGWRLFESDTVCQRALASGDVAASADSESSRRLGEYGTGARTLGLMDSAGSAGPESYGCGQPAVNIAQAVEVHRLAVAGREPVIARQVGRRVARLWLGTSRFADVGVLASATLTLGPDADAFYGRGWARNATGQPRLAPDDYDQALTLYREVGDPGNIAATLNNIGRVYDGLGDRRQALSYYQQALPTLREVGNRAGEAATLNNIHPVGGSGSPTGE
ncbi:tetratricopeptide repeat protein [Dactylosporangium sp. NPDC050688]|uniref:tetratricopeptide repeat protein n=1 Tax=Dactylosporangium sp. NPDC050688 TaxID=3157217 RepID=UPI003407BB53